jgi:uncharacterized protein YkwD
MDRRFHKLFTAFLASAIAVMAAAAQASAACPNADLVPTAENLPAVRAALICLHNEERAKAKVELLRADRRLDTAAQGHAEDMVARKYFALDTPDGVDPYDRLKRTGYVGRRVVWNAGETIAWGTGAYATPRQIMASWLASTSKRLMLLAPNFRHIGVGITLGAPVVRAANAWPALDTSSAVTYTVDFGWRTKARALRRCLRRATKSGAAAHRRLMQASCRGLKA